MCFLLHASHCRMSLLVSYRYITTSTRRYTVPPTPHFAVSRPSRFLRRVGISQIAGPPAGPPLARHCMPTIALLVELGRLGPKLYRQLKVPHQEPHGLAPSYRTQ